MAPYCEWTLSAFGKVVSLTHIVRRLLRFLAVIISLLATVTKTVTAGDIAALCSSSLSTSYSAMSVSFRFTDELCRLADQNRNYTFDLFQHSVSRVRSAETKLK